MLRLFGIPYITAPMEAEAQCAALVELGLVEGIITDDSDVFLFGGARVYKNMFNQSKTVECFFLADFARELGIDREKLVQLAYLLGSDYVEGLSGVGPVVAMELLKEFPGSDSLHEFKDWWQRVQSGRDKPEESQSNFRRRFVGRLYSVAYHCVGNLPVTFHAHRRKGSKPFIFPMTGPTLLWCVRDAGFTTPQALMTARGMPTTTPRLIILKNRSSGDSQTLMDYASKRVQARTDHTGADP